MRTICGALILVTLSSSFSPLVLISTRAGESPGALESTPSGWTDLLAHAGPDLKGWTRLPIPARVKRNSESASQWSFDPATRVLTCRGDGGHEWLRYDQEFSDFILHVEWKFTPVEGKSARYNSGVYVRNSADASIWHQAQTGDASGGFLFGDTPVHGVSKRINLSKEVSQQRVKPAGEWNSFEITCAGKRMTLWVNGAVTCVYEGCESAKGFVGLEAEGYRVEFKNIRMKVTE